jgi:hypothetical protein
MDVYVPPKKKDKKRRSMDVYFTYGLHPLLHGVSLLHGVKPAPSVLS